MEADRLSRSDDVRNSAHNGKEEQIEVDSKFQLVSETEETKLLQQSLSGMASMKGTNVDRSNRFSTQSNQFSQTRERGFTNQWMPDFVPKKTLTKQPEHRGTGGSGASATNSMSPVSKDSVNNEGWVEFDQLEVENAMSKGNDPRSWSRIICNGCCLLGPKESSTSPVVTNFINFAMIGLNIGAMLYALHGMWNWLSWIAIALGCLTQVLIWFVQCSDPGILHRDQDKSKLTAMLKMQQTS